MYLKKRLKIMRKYDADFWSFMYVRRRKNNFFVNFRLSLVVRLVKLYYNNFFLTKIKSKKYLRKLTMKLKQNRSSLKIFFKTQPIKIRKFFRKRLNVIRKIFFNYKYKIKSLNYKYGERAAFKLFKTKKIKSPYSRLRLFIKRIVLFYNNFNNKMLLKFANLSNKGFGGSLNFFFYNLESRLDSILIRSNVATKFFIRNLIRTGFVRVNNLKVTYLNFIIKLHDIVSFDQTKRQLIYTILKGTVRFKRFFSQPPFYLEINYRTLCITLIPKLIDPSFIAYPFQTEEGQSFLGLHTMLWGW